jgi:hypothetical protein
MAKRETVAIKTASPHPPRRHAGLSTPTTRCSRAAFRSQGIEKLHSAVSRGIIRDGFAATTVSMDRQIPTWRPGGMARRRPRNLQHPMFRRQMRSRHGRCPVGHPAPRPPLVDDRPAPRLQGMRNGRFCEHRTELARQNRSHYAIHQALENVRLRF